MVLIAALLLAAAFAYWLGINKTEAKPTEIPLAELGQGVEGWLVAQLPGNPSVKVTAIYGVFYEGTWHIIVGDDLGRVWRFKSPPPRTRQ